MFKIGRIVDLSLSLTDKTPVYPGDPIPKITVATTIDKEGYNLFNVLLGSQTGSHVDAPYHFRNDGITIDKIDLKACMGKAIIIDVSRKKAMEAIEVSDLTPHAEFIKEAEIVLFRTDWYKKAGTEEFYEHPYLSEGGGRFLLTMGIKTVGVDAINLDMTGGTYFPIHDMYAQAEGLIAENLANFDKVDFINPFVIVLPLKLVGCDGSPVRAVAVEFLLEA